MVPGVGSEPWQDFWNHESHRRSLNSVRDHESLDSLPAIGEPGQTGTIVPVENR